MLCSRSSQVAGCGSQYIVPMFIDILTFRNPSFLTGSGALVLRSATSRQQSGVSSQQSAAVSDMRPAVCGLRIAYAVPIVIDSPLFEKPPFFDRGSTGVLWGCGAAICHQQPAVSSRQSAAICRQQSAAVSNLRSAFCDLRSAKVLALWGV